jgi:hypothetical protein
MTLHNLSQVPSPGTTSTTYNVVWTSSDGKQYATQVAAPDPSGTLSYLWGLWDPDNNQLTGFTRTTGTFNPGANGTITVNVPLSGIGNPTIPIADPSQTAAVTNPFGLTFAGEGALGNGTRFTTPMDVAPDTGGGARWAVCPPVQLVSVVSRKTHGSGGTFDIDLPQPPATPGVECRKPGATGDPGVDYKLVFTFLSPMTNCGAASTGSVSSGPNPNQCTVNLTGVPNAQYTRVTLTGAVNSTGATGNVSGTMGVLLGDVNASGRVDSTDVFQVRQQSLQNVNSSNFRMDVNESGRVDATDVFIVRQQTLTSLPKSP